LRLFLSEQRQSERSIVGEGDMEGLGLSPFFAKDSYDALTVNAKPKKRIFICWKRRVVVKR
jgi:hypothetical protein